jgi:choloylglycine hydrolase
MIKRQMLRMTVATNTACALLLSSSAQSVLACTGITLKATDGSVVFGRTLEWGSFDLKSRLAVIPRGYKYATHMTDEKTGLSWEGKYGVVGIDAVEKDFVVEGMNEKGLAVGLFYHPDFAEYQEYDAAQAAQSLSPTDVGQYLLTSFATVDEVRDALAKVRVVPVVEPALGFVTPVHFIVTETKREGHRHRVS